MKLIACIALASLVQVVQSSIQAPKVEEVQASSAEVSKPEEKQVEALPPAQVAEPMQETPPTQPITVATAGTKTDWLIAAGIPETDWYYVDCVINGCEGVSAEGGWNGTQKWNTTGSGAYGLCQALPASKMASAGADYTTNPVTQLKWCHSYAQSYGGWRAAWNFRKCTGYCYSPRTKTTPSKDHTWW